MSTTTSDDGASTTASDDGEQGAAVDAASIAGTSADVDNADAEHTNEIA